MLRIRRPILPSAEGTEHHDKSVSQPVGTSILTQVKPFTNAATNRRQEQGGCEQGVEVDQSQHRKLNEQTDKITPLYLISMLKRSRQPVRTLLVASVIAALVGSAAERQVACGSVLAERGDAPIGLVLLAARTGVPPCLPAHACPCGSRLGVRGSNDREPAGRSPASPLTGPP